ncbi:MAG: hypothetical protein M3015_06305 [Bacteroidota bacterium]|nr:hypothetical protein [Bacteroidota bacterium]
MPETRNTKTAIRNRNDGFTLLLYKATISNAIVANTIKDDIYAGYNYFTGVALALSIINMLFSNLKIQ